MKNKQLIKEPAKRQMSAFSSINFKKALKEQGLSVEKFLSMTRFSLVQIRSWSEEKPPTQQDMQYLEIFFDKPKDYFTVKNNKPKRKKQRSLQKCYRLHYTEEILEKSALQKTVRSAIEDWILHSGKSYTNNDSKKWRADFRQLVEQFKSNAEIFGAEAVSCLIENTIKCKAKTIRWESLKGETQ